MTEFAIEIERDKAVSVIREAMRTFPYPEALNAFISVIESSGSVTPQNFGALVSRAHGDMFGGDFEGKERVGWHGCRDAGEQFAEIALELAGKMDPRFRVAVERNSESSRIIEELQPGLDRLGPLQTKNYRSTET